MEPMSYTRTNHIMRGDRCDNYRQVIEDGVIDYSSFRELQADFTETCISIKYVLSGTEQYILDGKQYDLSEGSYLLLTGVEHGRVMIDSKNAVKGVCIGMSYAVVNEVLSGLSFQETDTASLRHFLEMKNLPTQILNAGSTTLGHWLRARGAATAAGHFDRELMYSITELMLTDQALMHQYLKCFDTVRSETRKDLLGKLLTAKAYIDAHFTSQLDIACIAKTAHISEYYFLRLFKKVFKQSPYQYLLQKRLAYAANLLDTKDLSIVEIAYSSGFSDIYRFSKSFKTTFGMAPTFFRKRKK
jgi:AraC family transcriptional regulator